MFWRHQLEKALVLSMICKPFHGSGIQVNQEAVKAAAVAAAIEASAAAAVIREAARNIKAAADQKERERDQQQRQWSCPVDSPPREPAAGTAKERAVKVGNKLNVDP